MADADFDDLVETRERETASTAERTVAYQVVGSALTTQEVKDRLSANLYDQLTDGSDTTATKAAERAVIHAATIASRLGRVLNLNDTVMREITLLLTINELHLALGHAEEGKEYRLKAKDLIIAAFGDYPDSENKDASSKPQLGAVTTEARQSFPRKWP